MPPLNPVRPFNATIRTGLVFLILASLAKWFLHPGAGIAAGLVDGIVGLLYGVAIGCMLVGLRKSESR